jgi:hypothetical protein
VELAESSDTALNHTGSKLALERSARSDRMALARPDAELAASPV